MKNLAGTCQFSDINDLVVIILFLVEQIDWSSQYSEGKNLKFMLS